MVLSLRQIGFLLCVFTGTLNFPYSTAGAGDIPDVFSSPYLVRSWQTEQGLPHDMVLAITQTRDGYLWLGTENGLARFDGVKCRVFGTKDGLDSLEVSQLLEDSRGRLWIGTRGGGLSCYENGAIRTFTTADGLPGEVIEHLMEYTNGEVWVSTSAGGVSCWRNGRFESVGDAMKSLYIRAMVKDRKGKVWIATLQKWLWGYEGGKFFEITREPGMGGINASYLLVDHQDKLWAALGGGGLLCCDNGKWIGYGSKDGLPQARITCLEQTADGTIWAGSLDEGLYYSKNGNFMALHTKDGLSDESIASLFVDRDDNLWAGTLTGGLDRITPKQLSVCRIVEEGVERRPISLAQTTNGDLWISASGHGIYSWHGDEFEQLLQELPMSGHRYVGALLGAHDGSLWWGAGPALFQWKDGTILSSFNNEPWLRGDRVIALCENQDGGIWIGTYNGQLRLLKEGQFVPVTGLSGKPVSALAQETNGTLWIGFLGGGLGRLQNGKISIFTDKDGLGSNLVRDLLIDADGTLWIGTESGGLTRWSHGRFVTFTSEQGLIDDTILQIQDDNRGNLWLGCNRGICRVSKQALDSVATGQSVTVRLRVFGQAEGMASEQCVGNFASSLKTRSGQLCFCTSKGIVIIDPALHQPPDKPPDVLLEDMLIDDGLAKAKTVSLANMTEGSIEIPPGRHRLDIHYTGLNFSAPDKIQFRYQMDGLDAGWVRAQENRTATYNYIPPGHYRFHVSARNSDGLWNENEAEIYFDVLPHFWQAAWFEILTGVVILGLTGGGIRYVERRRYRARLRRLELERAMEQERSRIARDLHDELGSSLARISMLSDPSLLSDNKIEQFKQRVEKISNFAVQTARSLDQIVWAVNPRNDSLRSLLIYLTQFARELFDDTAVHCRFLIPDDIPPITLPPEMRHNIFLVVKESLTNAFKHAHAREVLLRVQIDGGNVEISVQDDGAGFDLATVQSRGERNGLQNMRHRAEAIGGRFSIETSPGKGTIVRLALVCKTRQESDARPAA
jgi:signal transduction histidine kinase/ligand-binding sensor domain-containing protein